MKKRVLSFLVACVMVVSTFIISKPLVHVHAVEGEETTEWKLPMDWSTGNKSENTAGDLFTTDRGWDYAERADGLWKFAFYTDVDAGEAYTAESQVAAASGSNKGAAGLGPAPYIESAQNRFLVKLNDYNGWKSWYVGTTGRWQGTSIGCGDNSTYMKFTHKVKGYVPAVVFVAPEDGLYSFSELVTGNLFSYTYTWTTDEDGDGKKETTNTKEFPVINSIATVRKNGAILASFNPTADDPTKTLTGEVSLKAGEELAFVFEQIDSAFCPNLPDGNNATYYQFKLGETVVKKIGEYPESNYVAKVDLTPRFEVGSYTDKLGNVTLMGVNITTRELYEITSYVTETNNNSWLALDPFGKHGTSYSLYGNNKGYNLLWGIDKETGLIMAVGGSQLTNNTGSALVFEAPYDGTFSFEVMMTSCYPYAEIKSGGVVTGGNYRYHDFTIAKEDGTILTTTHNEGATAKHASVTITAAAELKAGEKVIITKTPHANGATQFNASCNGNASVSIYEVEHTCSADTVKLVAANDATCVAGGTVAYYACSCGAKYANADATGTVGNIDTPVDEDAHAPNSAWTTNETGHWHVCDNGCNEQLDYAVHNYSTGTCVCDKACPHAEYADGKCVACGTDCEAHDMANAEGKCANCGMSHTHTVTADDANCKEGAICGECHYEVAPIKPDKHTADSTWISNGDGTHYEYHPCCYVAEETSTDCVYGDDNFCDKCGYDCTVDKAEDNFSEVFDSIYNNGETDYEADGPSDLNELGAAVKGDDVSGFTYGGFNLEMVSADADYVYLRHHILLDGDLVVKVNGEAVTLVNVDGNYYYFDVKVMIGDFADAHTITVEGTTVVTASVHSYMKTAFEADLENEKALSDAQANLLKALYDWDKAVADAN